jgi:hypothetical protein
LWFRLSIEPEIRQTGGWVDTDTNSPGLAALADVFLRIGNPEPTELPDTEWNSLVVESDRILKIVARHTRPAVVDSTAHSLAKIIRISNDLGISSATQNAAVVQSEKARAGKQVRTDRRWRVIRCAIVSVCRKQKLKMVASDCFAASIRTDVLKAAKKFDHSDLTKGTSTRTIERHIAALLNDPGLLNAILEECEFQEWL